MTLIPALVLAALMPQDNVQWMKSWPEALAEAKKSNRLALLVFFNKGVKNCQRFEAEALADPKVKEALSHYVCVMVDPEGSDDDNRLWQKHQMPSLPMSFIYDPDGRQLTSVSALLPKYYAEGLNAAGPAYFEKIVPAREALAKDPNQPDRLAMLGDAYARLNNPKESADWYAKAVAMCEGKGDKAGALKILGEQVKGYYETKWYAQARGAARKLIELDPSNGTRLCPLAAWVIGMADCEDRKWSDAIANLKSACEKYKDSEILDKMMFSLGAAYMYAKDKENALKVFDQIVEKFPDSESANLAKIQADKLRAK